MQSQNVDRKKSTQNGAKKRRMTKMSIVRFARSQQITVTTNTNTSGHPLAMTKWIIERRQRHGSASEWDMIPHENNKLYKNRLTIAEGKRKCWTKFLDSFPYHCAASAGHLSTECYTNRTSVAKHGSDDVWMTTTSSRNIVIVASFGERRRHRSPSIKYH